MSSDTVETPTRSPLRRIFYEHSGSRLRATWRIMAVLAVALPLYDAAFPLVSALRRRLIGPDPSQQGLLVANLGTFAGFTLLITAAALVALLIASRLDGRAPTSYGFDRSTDWAQDFGGGVGIGVIAVVVSLLYTAARGKMRLSIESTGVGFQSPFVAAVVVAIMLAYILAGNVFEEVVFRGIFIRMASEGLQARSIGYAPAVVVGFLSSVPVFGFYHIFPFLEGGLRAVVTGAVGGILFGVAYVLTGRLGLPIGVHFGGVAWFAIMQKPLYFGLTFPSLLVAEPLVEFTFAGVIELWVVRAFTGIILVGLWVRLVHGEVHVAERFSQPD